MWWLSVTCTVYLKGDWFGGLMDGAFPVKEQNFVAVLEDPQDLAQSAQAVKQCVHECEQWVNSLEISLCTHVIVTVYSLEVEDDATRSSDRNGDHA